MQGTREFGNALVIALISLGLIIGALSISLVEFNPEATPPAVSLIPSPAPLTATQVPPPAITPTLSLESFTPSNTSTATATALPPANCQTPSGWGQTTVQVGDTLESIAASYRISSDDLRKANCLLSNSLIPGSKLYVPPVAPNTSVACVPGLAGWIKNYIVQAGDNLFRIAVDHYTTLELMRKVNCRNGDTIFPGDVLWVPNVSATRTANPSPYPGSTITPFPTDPLTETALPFTATFFPSPTTQPPTNTLPPTVTASPTVFP
jgi:LysM repeat protein